MLPNHQFTPALPAVCPIDEADLVRSLLMFAPIWETLPHTVFFVKNTQAQYLYCNKALLKRLQLGDIRRLLGRTAAEVFDNDWGEHYTKQDLQVLGSGKPLNNELELHNYLSGGLGWCITHKVPIYDTEGSVIATMGMSVDIAGQDANKPELNKKIARVAQYLRAHFDQNISMKDLENLVHLSAPQIERYFKKVFHLTPMQYLQKVRIDHAITLLKGDMSIADIAIRCGYTDHSAFSRQFKASFGIPPSSFRQSN